MSHGRHRGARPAGQAKITAAAVILAVLVVAPVAAVDRRRTATWNAPPVDVARLLALDQADERRPGVPRRVGYPHAAGMSPADSGIWEDLPAGGQMWRLTVRSPGALWIVAGFDRFLLQPGGELTVSDVDRRRVLGPFGSADVRRHGQLWFPPLPGDTVRIELYWPEAMRGVEPRLRLATVSHGYRPLPAFGIAGKATLGPGDSGACNVDVSCPLGDAWQDARRGIVVLLNGGFTFCSGSLISTTAEDCRPYVLTAAHCGAGPSTTFGFNYEQSECGGGTAPPPNEQSLSGATVLAEDAASDFTLMELDLDPPAEFAVYFNGWSRGPAAPLESWILHHPNGDVKKISYNDDVVGDGTTWGPTHWRVDDWEAGTTEAGSSGGPLFDPDGRIVGQLHGGPAACANPTGSDEFGKLAAAWTGGGTLTNSLREWLDPLEAGQSALDGTDATTCEFRSAARLTLNRTVYRCVDTVAVGLWDDDLQGNASWPVDAFSTTESSPESVTLSAEGPGAGRFAGNVSTVTIGAAPDGAVSVAHGDTLTVGYVDADDGAGGLKIAREATATIDCLPPAIFNVRAETVTGSSASIAWDTDEAADGTVRYGPTPALGLQLSDGDRVVPHQLSLADLDECTTYYYEVESIDLAGNLTVDDNVGNAFTFRTGRDNASVLSAADTPRVVPDDDPVGTTSTIPVTDSRIVTDVTVQVHVQHSYTGDLTLMLTTPAGTVITLSDRHGGSGDDYLDTVFDDDAAQAIAQATAPFTGSFRPDGALAGAVGEIAAGNWRFTVIDPMAGDTGSLVSWSLTLGYEALACGPHAAPGPRRAREDSCSTGGAGHGDGTWDAGEQIEFELSVVNDGTQDLHGVTATIVPLTPGATMLDDTAAVGDVPTGSSSGTTAPHFVVRLPGELVCGEFVDLAAEIVADEGAWTTTFRQAVGLEVLLAGSVLDEQFGGGVPPPDWTVVDGASDGRSWFGDAVTDPTSCNNLDPAAPLAGNWAAVDSDCAGPGVSLEEELVGPVLDLAAATGVTLDFDHWFRRLGAELADVDVRSSLTAGEWSNVGRWTGASTVNPQSETIDISAEAAGATDVQLRWRYHNADDAWYWYVDNVRVTFVEPGGCAMTACAPLAAPPPFVPDGTGSSVPLRVNKLESDASRISVAWDDSCGPGSAKLIYGPLEQMSNHAVTGALCAVTNPQTWDAVPAGDLWFVVVGEDGTGVEGSWGSSTFGERNGLVPSGTCGVVYKDVAGSCP